MKHDFSTTAQMTDEELCGAAAAGDRLAEEALVLRYTRLVRVCARPFFLAGGDSEDLIQEGMMGLLKAVREYDPRREASFRTYAEVCIRNRFLSAIRAAAQNKHSPLNSAVSIEAPLLDNGSTHFSYGSEYQSLEDPEAILIDRESLQERMNALKCQLSSFEVRILSLYLSGLSYAEIAAEVLRSPKAVDNAVQRIRHKLARQLQSGDVSES